MPPIRSLSIELSPVDNGKYFELSIKMTGEEEDMMDVIFAVEDFFRTVSGRRRRSAWMDESAINS